MMTVYVTEIEWPEGIHYMTEVFLDMEVVSLDPKEAEEDIRAELFKEFGEYPNSFNYTLI